jgi:hypothetical protein
MMKLDWHKAKPITFEYLRGRYSYGDLVFAGLTIEGVLDGVLHLTGFMPKVEAKADLFVLFKDIRRITQDGEVNVPVLRYRVETLNAAQSLKRLTLQFDNGSTMIDYRDDLLCLCRLPNGEFTEL